MIVDKLVTDVVSYRCSGLFTFIFRRMFTMNTKKILVSALAAAVAVSSAALSVSALTPGVTTNDVKSPKTVVEAGKNTRFMVIIDGVTVEADVPADAIPAGTELTFGAATITNVDIEAAVANLPDVASSKILDVYFLDGDNNAKTFEGANVALSFANSNYDTVYLYEEAAGLTKFANFSNAKASGTAPHFSYYILVKNAEKQQSQPSQQSQTQPSQQSQQSQPGVNTGDSAASAAVFAVIGAAALGTAIVASKSKKSAK